MERQYVGIDLHRRSSTIYRMAEDGEVLGCSRIPSQPFELAQAMRKDGSASVDPASSPARASFQDDASAMKGKGLRKALDTAPPPS